MFYQRLCHCCIEKVAFPRESKLWRLYEDGQERMDKEFDIVKIIKNIRNLKILLKR